MLHHGASWRILRPHGEQSNGEHSSRLIVLAGWFALLSFRRVTVTFVPYFSLCLR